MRPLLLVSVGVTMTVCAYVFWPRTPSLATFDPKSRTRLEVAMLRQVDNAGRGLLPAWQLMVGDFGLPPIEAAAAAWHLTDALQIHSRAIDAPQEERAREPLEKFFRIIAKSTRVAADPEALARAELNVWRLETARSPREKIVGARAELLALVHGRKPGDWAPVASEITAARAAAREERWNEAQRHLTAAWTIARRVLDSTGQN